MKYQSSNTGQIYNVEFKKKSNVCPECSHNRKKKTDPCLAYYKETETAYCWNCNTTFFKYQPKGENKAYFVPKWENITNLSDKTVKWFIGRKISQKTLLKARVYTTREFMPQHGKEVECMCFPFFMDGKLINTKYRGPEKSFKLVSKAELIFWNIDILKEAEEVVIVEGEIDALTYIENRIENVLSVPNGANKNLEYLDNHIEKFDEVKKIYISTDNDTKGLELRDELIRRFGAERCFVVSFKECKDANEFYNKYDGDQFKECLINAKPVPVKGIVNAQDIRADLLDLFENGIKPGKKIGHPVIDEHITWELQRLCTVTGVPGCGKSEIVDYITTKLNLRHGWKAAFFSPENFPLKYHYAKIFEKLSGRKFERLENVDDFDIAYDYIKDNFHWILNEEDMTLDAILEAAKSLIKSKGIKVLVLDPYNKIDHQIKGNQSETQYIGQFLDKLIMFGKLNNILIFLIAHPRKMENGAVPTLYDISGSAHFYNKTDYGFTVDRPKDPETNLMTTQTDIHFQKIKFKHLGKQGLTELEYNINNGRYKTHENEAFAGTWDNSNWLIHDVDAQGFAEIAPNVEFENEAPF